MFKSLTTPPLSDFSLSQGCYNHSVSLPGHYPLGKSYKSPHDGRNVTIVLCVDDLLWMGGIGGGRGGF